MPFANISPPSTTYSTARQRPRCGKSRSWCNHAQAARINHQHAVRAFEKAGIRLVRQGKHIMMSDGVRIITIPRHNPIHAITMGGMRG
jgi:hypothetical protein